MAWYRVWYSVKAPEIKYYYLVEVDGEEDQEKAEKQARDAAMSKFWSGERPVPVFDDEEQDGTFYTYPVDDESVFQEMSPSDPEFKKRTIFSDYFIVPEKKEEESE